MGAGFERQKHSRRKKTAQAKNDAKAIERLEAEYVVLKGLEMEKLADQHLRRTLGKVKSLKDAPALQEYIGGLERANVDSATLNVTARLFKVPGVKKVVDGVIEDLKGVLGVGGVAEKLQNGKVVDDKKKTQKASEGQKENEDMLDVSDEEGDPYEVFNARIAAPSSGEDDSEASVTDDERPPSIGDSDSEHDPDDDPEEVSEDSDLDSIISANLSTDTKAKRTALLRAIATPSDISDSDSDSESDEPAVPTKTKKLKSLDPKTTSSAFLPALSHANYFSGSESSASDLDAEVAPRKNRRGQRARQKIAEAKFGAGAKHIEKQRRNEGWDPKRGAVSDEKRGRGERGGVARGGRGPQQSGTNAEPLGQKKSGGVKRDDKGELHPSWQAAKAAKESKKLKIDVGGTKTQGKKVVFD